MILNDMSKLDGRKQRLMLCLFHIAEWQQLFREEFGFQRRLSSWSRETVWLNKPETNPPCNVNSE